ncbi:hypothetical protein TRIUR3_31541 [Triticum urartu]|uniref:Uncharacterized protein n=1 Tax=Triticum urartu TaxID=4572 RepID=M7Z744_TRIUA|nr:hypothetical protein TRIUR3_31541 [Triticum urartu]
MDPQQQQVQLQQVQQQREPRDGAPATAGAAAAGAGRQSDPRRNNGKALTSRRLYNKVGSQIKPQRNKKSTQYESWNDADAEEPSSII